MVTLLRNYLKGIKTVEDGKNELVRLLVERHMRKVNINWMLQTLESGDIAKIKLAYDTILGTLCPPPCGSIEEKFWATPAGQYLIQCRYTAYKGRLIPKSAAARLWFDLPAGEPVPLKYIQAINHRIDSGQLQAVRRPYSAYKHRKGTDLASAARSIMLIKEEVLKLKKARE